MGLLVDPMCGLSHDVLLRAQARVLRLLERWNSRDAEHVVVEAQNRAGGRPGNNCGDGYSCSRGGRQKGLAARAS